MFIAIVSVSLLMAALMVFAALRKLSHREDVVASYARVGVRESQLNLLAAILLAGAIGLVLGLFWPPIGVAAAAGLVVYFLLAVVAHIRANDAANLPTPLVLLLLAATLLALRSVAS